MKSQMITAKTHLYIKIRTYASKYHIKNRIKTKAAIKAHNDAAKTYTAFFGLFVDRFSGTTMNELFQTYMSAYDVAREISHEKTGVYIARAEANEIYCIPKTDLGIEIFDWIIENCKNDFEVIKKTRGTYTDYGPETFFRENYKREIKNA